jgi:DNA-binding LytR/AlgR family response regulator
MLITVKINGVKCQRNVADIIYAEACGNNIVLHFNDTRAIKYYCSLKKFLAAYGSPQGLVSAHRHYAININYISQIIKYCLVQIKTGAVFSTGRQFYKIAVRVLGR